MTIALITGITGQDGVRMARLLLDKGYVVYGTYRRSSSVNFWRINKLGIQHHPGRSALNTRSLRDSSAARPCRPHRPAISHARRAGYASSANHHTGYVRSGVRDVCALLHEVGSTTGQSSEPCRSARPRTAPGAYR
jgi:hypothetical protein